MTSVAPSTFGVEAFAERFGLGSATDQLVLGEVAITEWEATRLQVLPDKLQLGFKRGADAAFTRQVLAGFLERVDELAPDAQINFNAAMRLMLDDGDADPSAELIDAGTLASTFDGKGGRGGVTLIYKDGVSRWWIELSPEPENERAWMFDYNRHFADFPDPGEERNGVIEWFADVEADLVARFETISSGVDK